MATRTITRWHITRNPATATRAAYAYVQLHGKETHGLFGGQVTLVTETFHIPLEPGATDGRTSDQELIKKAIALSAHTWKGRIP